MHWVSPAPVSNSSNCFVFFVGTRGQGGNVLILEEAAFIDQAIYETSIAPLLMIKNTSLIGISSPQDENNFYSKLISLKKPNTNEPFFRVIQFTLVCQKHRAEGKAESCFCYAHMQPPWKPKGDMARARVLMMNNSKAAERELMGEITSSNLYAFSREHISYWMERPRYLFDQKPHVLFLCIDPAGGGTQSDMALCVIAYNLDEDMVVVGMDSVPIESDKTEEEFLVRYLRNLYSTPLYAGAALVVMVERNMAVTISTRLFSIAQRYVEGELGLKCVQLRAGPNREGQGSVSSCGRGGGSYGSSFLESSAGEPTKMQPGFWTSNSNKHEYVRLLQNYLDNKRLRLSDTFVTTKPGVVEECAKQLQEYRREIKQTNSSGIIHVSYTGKSAGQKDDLCMTLQMAAYWSMFTINHSYYYNMYNGNFWSVFRG